MAKTTPWNKIKNFAIFLREYEYCLDFEIAQQKSFYKLKDFNKTTKNYYVYCLINPLNKKIFYIGKGKNKRALQHYKEFKKGKCLNNFKQNEIKTFAKYGYKPIIKVFADDLSEQKAYYLETKLIKRLYKNLTNISMNENEPNILKREVRKMMRNMPSYQQWITGVYFNNPTVFDALKNKNYGYDLYLLVKQTIINLAKEYELCQI